MFDGWRVIRYRGLPGDDEASVTSASQKMLSIAAACRLQAATFCDLHMSPKLHRRQVSMLLQFVRFVQTCCDTQRVTRRRANGRR